jgi:CubicO group peptidase (beta-lactamase class C family)
MLNRRQLAAAPLLLAAASPLGANAQDEAPWAWPESSLEALGFDPTVADRLVEELPNYPAVTAVVVIRNGQLAFEHYRRPDDAATLVNIRSVTKSLTSTLIGIALHRGDLESIDLTLGKLIPDRIPADADPAVADITLRSFLTMTSGLWWDGHEDWSMLLESDNWTETTLSQPIVAEQGEQFLYNTGGSHLIGVALAAVIGRPLEEYAREHLFSPLGIRDGDWMRSPQGEVNGGAGLELTPRDTAKLGQLLLQHGRWVDTQLLSEDYATASTTWQSEGESITGGSIGVAYGFQWWVTDDTGYEAYFALGFGGQYVYVVPDLDVVIVVAARFEDGEQPVLTSHRPISEQIVIPAILDLP